MRRVLFLNDCHVSDSLRQNRNQIKRYFVGELKVWEIKYQYTV